MGIGISRWQLARAVSSAGQLGVVSGVALDAVVSRMLQLGDPGGHYRRALASFPDAALAARVLARYFRPGGIAPGAPFLLPSAPHINMDREHQELFMAANFAEVWLAREGHHGPVGINYLEKLQMVTLPSVYGAMLAGVNFVLMGAGIPREIPAALDRLAAHEETSLRVGVQGAVAGEDTRTRFDPRQFGCTAALLTRPQFLAIVSSTTLARMLVKLGAHAVNGLVIETSTAGGHNAPPRDAAARNERGEPVYGVKDEVDLDIVRALGVPFWLAGSYGTPEGLRAALAAGAAGIQAGSAFALCREAGLEGGLKSRLIERAAAGKLEIRTDPAASPTGFPFKVARLAGTLSEDAVFLARPRVCDVGGLAQPYLAADGSIDYRCPAEPIAAYIGKGGNREETVGRKCLCNALLANTGLGQRRGGVPELPLVTLGDAAAGVTRFMLPETQGYSARRVISVLLGESV